MLNESYSLQGAPRQQGNLVIELYQLTDCASLYDHVVKDVTLAKDERTRYAALLIKEDVQK